MSQVKRSSTYTNLNIYKVHSITKQNRNIESCHKCYRSNQGCFSVWGIFWWYHCARRQRIGLTHTPDQSKCYSHSRDGGSMICTGQSVDCLHPYFAQATSSGSRVLPDNSRIAHAKHESMVCAGQSTDCPNPYSAHNIIYIYTTICLQWHKAVGVSNTAIASCWVSISLCQLLTL